MGLGNKPKKWWKDGQILKLWCEKAKQAKQCFEALGYDNHVGGMVLKLLILIAMQDKYLGFWPFPIFILNQEDIYKSWFLNFFWWQQEAKYHSWQVQLQWTGSIKCQRYEAYWAIKPKIIPSLSACKYNSINLHRSNHLCNTPESHDLKDLTYFWLCPPNNY